MDVRMFVINSLAGSDLVSKRVRYVLLRTAGLDLGRVRMAGGCWFGSRSVVIGDGTYINRHCFFDGLAPITIGRNCAIGMQTLFVTSEHELGGADRRASVLSTARPIEVGDGCWLGARVTVLPGVTIGRGCVIASGSVVTADCRAHGLYAGVPARRLRDLSEE